MELHAIKSGARWCWDEKNSNHEDDQLFHEALQRALKKAGYQVAGAFSLAQGYEVLKEHPSLLIIDRNLPDGDGLELCRKARASGGIPALFLTARDEEEMIKAFDLGQMII